MRGGWRQFASKLQLIRQQLLHLSTTPATTSDIRQARSGHRPTQAKSLSLGEYVFLTDITFMFTHSFQLSVLILFYCTIHSLFSFLRLLLVCLNNLKKNQKTQLQLLASLLSMHVVVVVIKRKPKKISRSSFGCWELSCVNRFISFLILWGPRGEDHDENVEWLSNALLLI